MCFYRVNMYFIFYVLRYEASKYQITTANVQCVAYICSDWNIACISGRSVINYTITVKCCYSNDWNRSRKQLSSWCTIALLIITIIINIIKIFYLEEERGKHLRRRQHAIISN